MSEEYSASSDCFDTIAYTYENGLLVETADSAAGETVTNTYDEYGNAVKTTTLTEKDGETSTGTVTSTYDIMGNVLETVSGEDTSSYIYDKAGRTLLADDNGSCTRTLYDTLGRTIQEISPEDYDSAKDGLPEENTYADANVGQRYIYDEATGNLKGEINRLDVATYYAYYEKSESVKTETFDLYKYEYSRSGDVQNVYIGGKTNSDGSYTGGDLYARYNYNADTDNLESIEYGNNQTVSYSYNSFGQVISQSYKESPHSEEITQFAYQYTSDAESEEDSVLLAKYDYNIGQKTVYSDDLVEIFNISYNENNEEVLEPYYSYQNTDAETAEDETETPAKLTEHFRNNEFVTETSQKADVFKQNNAELFRYNYNTEDESL